MRFRAHDTFYIRRGWLSKGIKNVQKDPTVFLGVNGNPMDILGIGANMVKALRYWLQAVGLTQESSVGRRIQTLTPLGEIVAQNDPYIEEIGTLWLLHYKLVTNRKEATAWYYFFNEFRLNEFTRDDFISQISHYIHLYGEEVAEKSLKDDFNCLINTYLPRARISSGQMHPESNIDCPFGELKLIDIVYKKNKIYKKNTPRQDAIHPLILLSVILDQANNKNEIRISNIYSDQCNAGRVFNLDIITLTSLLYKIELLGYIKVERTAGLDIIRINTDLDFLGCIKKYYQSINNKI